MDEPTPTYRIKDWNRTFENHDSRRINYPRWVPMPNKHDGKSYGRLMGLPDGLCIFGAWVLIVEVASRMPVRGVLADHDGPLTAEDLHAKTRAPVEIFERALTVLSDKKIGWLTTEASTDPQAVEVESPALGREGIGGQGKTIQGQPLPRRTTPEIEPPFSSSTFVEALATYKASRTRTLKTESELLLYDDLREWGEEGSITALRGAAKAGHLQVLHPDKYRNNGNGFHQITRSGQSGAASTTEVDTSIWDRARR